MSDKKISQLTELTSVDGVNDFIPIVDSSSSETKKVSSSNLPVSTEQQEVLDLKASITDLNSEIDARKTQSFPYTVDFQSGTEQIRDLSSITSSDGYYNNSNLTSVYIGSNVTSIGGYAFKYCSSLTSITIPDSVTTIGSGAFYSCFNLTSMTIPDSVTSIGSYAFAYCSNLTNMTIPDSVTTIRSYAFASCLKLASVSIPDSVTSIGGDAFRYCLKLASITIPDSVTSIGSYAFDSCSSLATINCLATTAPTLGSNVFNNVLATQIHVPAGATGYGTTYGGLTVVADL